MNIDKKLFKHAIELDWVDITSAYNVRKEFQAKAGGFTYYIREGCGEDDRAVWMLQVLSDWGTYTTSNTGFYSLRKVQQLAAIHSYTFYQFHLED